MFLFGHGPLKGFLRWHGTHSSSAQNRAMYVVYGSGPYQGCTIAIEFAKITEHFLNLLNSIVIEPRLVSKWKKSEGLLLLILNFLLRDYWVYLRDWNPFLMHTATEVEIEMPLFLIHNCNRNWKVIVYRTATATQIENNNFHYHDCHWYWTLYWAFAETDMRLKFSGKLLSLQLLLNLIFSIIVTDVDTEQNIFVMWLELYSLWGNNPFHPDVLLRITTVMTWISTKQTHVTNIFVTCKSRPPTVCQSWHPAMTQLTKPFDTSHEIWVHRGFAGCF